MKIKRITLKNYRAAVDLTFDLDETLTVIAGVNGSGKSTILDAAAIMLSWLTARIKRDTGTGRKIQEIDMTDGNNYSLIEIEMLDDVVSWSLAKTRKGKNEQFKSNFVNLNKYVKQYRNVLESSHEMPVYAYYPVNRAVLDIPIKIRTRHNFDMFSIYDDALISSADFRLFFEWFREREDIENENRRYLYLDDSSKPENFQFPDKQLETVREALTKLLPDYTEFSIKRQPLRMVVKKSGKELRIDSLSDGEKGFIALVGDIARRLAIANPLKANSLKGEGTVLIDEIDLHLHPSWQRMIIPGLKEVFPNIQFIISTHSPQVLSEIEAIHLRIMKLKDNNLSVEMHKQSYGLTSLQVLQEIMGDRGRNEIVRERIEKIFNLIDAEEFQQARDEIEALKSKLNGDIPDLIEAESTILMLEPDNRDDI